VSLSVDLQRFLEAQSDVYERALGELKSGRKRTHWMWFIFPQALGLGQSATSKHYAITSMEHATSYLGHPILGSRLRESTRYVNNLKGRSATSIFGGVDALKFRSSMTLFSMAEPSSHFFQDALLAFYDGAPDLATLRILSRWGAATLE
jgi:uncharacterized protein (DUF1810 family)